MSLTMGTAPFGHAPWGRFNFEVPHQDVIYVEPSQRWIRARRGGETVLDSRRAKVLLRHGSLPRYFVPRADVRWEALEGVEPVEPPDGAPGLEDHVAFNWDDLDSWLEEDEELLGHAPDPYHRIDVRRTSRRVVVRAGDDPLADSTAARALFETGLPTRWYLPREDVLAALEPSELRTTCAYKGHASYFHARTGDRLLENLAWTYLDPRREAEPVRDLVCFFNEATDIDVDGEAQGHPPTPWGRPGWWKGPGPPR